MTRKYEKVVALATLNILCIYYVYHNLSADSTNKSLYSIVNGDAKKGSEEIVIGIDEEFKAKEIRHRRVMSMKNLLSFHTTSDTSTSVSSRPTNNESTSMLYDEELNKKLRDDKEIDLYPLTPIIASVQPKLHNKESFSQLMEQRKKVLDSQCSLKDYIGSITNTYMYVLESLSLIWCPVYKAASTNWMHNLLHLAGMNKTQIKKIIADHPNQPNEQGRVVAPVLPLKAIERMASQEDTKSLLIVRHPFDRLVSAFRDKIEQCHGPTNCTLSNNWYYKKYSRKIVAAYRKRAINKFGKSFFSKENNYGAPLPVKRTWRNEKLPSWWEFVQYIIHHNAWGFDEHWRPMSLYCGICSFPYNRILHFENIETEEKYFAKEISAKNAIHPRWENRNDEGFPKEEILRKYFDILEDAEIDALYKIYKDDFKMFGYQFKYKHFKLNVD